MLLEKICKELGVRVNEHWKGNDGKIYVIDEVGQLHHYNENDKMGGYVNVSNKIPKLIIGELKPKWKPANGEKYYAPDIIYTEKYTPSVWGDRIIDYWRLERGLVFKTKEEAIAAANKMLESLKE